jgi:hypothetical protein
LRQTDGDQTFVLHLDHGVQEPNLVQVQDVVTPTLSLNSVRNRLKATFLPEGFPNTVRPSYLKYTLMSCGQHFSNAIVGTMSMQSLLIGIGISQTAAIPIAATLQWVLKDGLGQLGAILFSQKIGRMFDLHTKMMYVTSVAAFHAAAILECLTPFFPSLFLPCASIANCLKNIAWIAASASKVKIHQSLCVDDRGPNMGDLTAKSASQATVSSILGTGAAIGISYCVGASPMSNLFVTSAAIAVGLGMCTKAMESVHFTSLTSARLNLLVRSFDGRTVPAPHAIGTRDLIEEFKEVLSRRTMVVNPPLSTLSPNQLDQLQNCVSQIDADHWLSLSNSGSRATTEPIVLYLHEECSPAIVVKAFCQVRHGMSNEQTTAFIQACTDAGWNVNNVDIEGRARSRRVKFDS